MRCLFHTTTTKVFLRFLTAPKRDTPPKKRSSRLFHSQKILLLFHSCSSLSEHCVLPRILPEAGKKTTLLLLFSFRTDHGISHRNFPLQAINLQQLRNARKSYSSSTLLAAIKTKGKLIKNAFFRTPTTEK